VVLCGTHIYTYVLYIATELAQHFRHTAPPDDLLYFWLLFVLLNFLRFVVAVPVFVNALRRLVRRQVGGGRKRPFAVPLPLRVLWPPLPFCRIHCRQADRAKLARSHSGRSH
jgi:hypothetical protein